MKQRIDREINSVVVGRAEDNDLAYSPCLADEVGGVCLRHIIDLDTLAALSAKLCCKCLRRRCRMSVQTSVDYDKSVVFRCAGRPLLILVDEPGNVLSPDRSVQRADRLDIERCSLLENVLDLNAVLTHDICIIPACVIEEILLEVVLIRKNTVFDGTECSERIG